VKYWRNHEDGEGGAKRVAVSSREKHTKLDGLEPNSSYFIEVRGYNSAGYGPPSKHLKIQTKKPRMLCFEAVEHWSYIDMHGTQHSHSLMLFFFYQLQIDLKK